MATEEHIAAQRCRQVGLDDAAALEAAGVLVRYDPALAALAWHRRRHGQRRYSLVGITHASASVAVRDAIGALATAPVQAWDAVICPSQSIRRAVSAVLDGWQSYLEARFGGAAACPIHLPVIPLGVDTVRFEKIAAPERRAMARRRLGVGEDAVVILYAGRLNYIAKANPLPLLVAAERVAQTLAGPIHLVLNGYFNDDENERAFDEAIAALCSKVRVAIVRHGHADYPDGLWAAADIFCSPTDNIQESFGLTPIEAMAAGLPSVVADWDGYRDTVRDTLDGFVVPTLAPRPGSGAELAYDYFRGRATYGDYLGAVSQSTAVDIDSLTRARQTLAANPDLRREMGQSARRRARDSFEWSRIIRDYGTLFADLNERRQVAAESAAPDKAAAGESAFHPSHPDPFAMFGSFPSAHLEPSGRLELTGISWSEAMRRIGLKVGLIVPQSLIELEELPLLIGQLEATGGATIDALASALQFTDRPRLERTLGWLVKLGICRYRPPE
jgi:glycosyltransferase involved in cell wall biosynthesis